MTQLSLVAFYGNGSARLQSWVEPLQTALSRSLGEAYRPYAPSQIHATVLGLEGWATDSSIWSLRPWEWSGERRPLQLDRVLRILSETSCLPFRVRLGGFAEHGRYPFTSRDRHPFERSFGFQGSAAVAMGWPVEPDGFPDTLDRLRRELAQAGPVHKYHRSPKDVDNDLYMVLGHVDPAGQPAAALREAEHQVREAVAALPPLHLDVDDRALSILTYSDPTVPAGTTRAYSLSEAGRRLTELEAAYPRKEPGRAR